MTRLKAILLACTFSLIAPSTAALANEIPGNTATVRLNMDIQSFEQPLSIWRQALRLIGIRGANIQYPAPGTGVTVRSSAYAPSPYQTDATPCVTAAGTRVRPGIVASNFLPFGTLLEINNEVYIVEDRMNSRYSNSIDIYFSSTSEALEFGRQELDVVIIGYGEPGQVLPREEPEEKPREESVIVAEDQSQPSFRERLAKSINRLQRAAGNLIGIRYDVNRYDVDCFSQE